MHLFAEQPWQHASGLIMGHDMKLGLDDSRSFECKRALPDRIYPTTPRHFPFNRQTLRGSYLRRVASNLGRV